MNCAVSAAHVVILMLWTSDCRAGDYRQLLYPARWGRSRLFSQTGCVGGLSGVTGLGGGGVGRVCGWVLAGSRTGCAMGLSRLGLFVPCSGVGGGLRSCPGYAKKGGARWWCPLPVRFGCGGVLLSHTLPGAVPSPCQVLASGFGMGPGVSPGPWPPQIFCYPSHGPRLRVFPRGIVVGWGPDSGRD